ncbi:MAG: hypothetical protein C0483_17850 [Pirellula sp.]|nr:hypothetical protein [Pirellula sp.]
MEARQSAVQLVVDAPSLQKASLTTSDLWRQIARVCDPKDTPERRFQKLNELMIRMDAGERSLKSSAAIKIVSQSKAIVRRDGRRLRELE